jgi:hypothetical protein
MLPVSPWPGFFECIASAIYPRPGGLFVLMMIEKCILWPIVVVKSDTSPDILHVLVVPLSLNMLIFKTHESS